MPRSNKKIKNKASGDFNSFFDTELDEIATPEDSLQDDLSDNKTVEEKSSNLEVNVPTDEKDSEYSKVSETAEHTSTDHSIVTEEIRPSSVNHHLSDAISNNFGLKISNSETLDPLIPKTYKLSESTIDRLESLVYKDKRRNKKIPGTKGFISDFVDNAIWLHLHGLGLATEDELNEHLKEYSKYPLNLNATDNLD